VIYGCAEATSKCKVRVEEADTLIAGCAANFTFIMGVLNEIEEFFTPSLRLQIFHPRRSAIFLGNP
jgi:hypothetical protein